MPCARYALQGTLEPGQRRVTAVLARVQTRVVVDDDGNSPTCSAPSSDPSTEEIAPTQEELEDTGATRTVAESAMHSSLHSSSRIAEPAAAELAAVEAAPDARVSWATGVVFETTRARLGDDHDVHRWSRFASVRVRRGDSRRGGVLRGGVRRPRRRRGSHTRRSCERVGSARQGCERGRERGRERRRKLGGDRRRARRGGGGRHGDAGPSGVARRRRRARRRPDARTTRDKYDDASYDDDVGAVCTSVCTSSSVGAQIRREIARLVARRVRIVGETQTRGLVGGRRGWRIARAGGRWHA